MKRFSLALRAALFALPLSLTAGCAWYAPADHSRAFAPAPESAADPAYWPERSISRLPQIINMGPDVLAVRVKYDILDNGRIVKAPKRLAAGDVEHSGLYGRGIIRFYRRSPGDPPAVSEGMCFFSGVEADSEEARRRWSAVAGGDRQPDIRNGESPWVVNLRGTWMRLDEPTAGGHRGLVVHLTSYGGYRYERPVIEELRSRGWAVLWVDSSTVRPSSPTRIHIDPDDLEPAAEAIAQNISDRVAEIAYAVEAGLDFVTRERRHIPVSPLVLCGYSAGALSAPAVAALMPDRFDAAVLVGGGANLLDISQRSALTDGGLKLIWEHPPTQAERERLHDLYLDRCRLDPYWASAALRDKPVLMFHAVLDKIVPASNGDLLHKRLGRPERVNFLLGHELLFFRLPAHADTIADWIDAQTQ